MSLGIDQDVGDVLDIANLRRPAPDLQQRVVGRGRRIGGVEQQHPPEAIPETGSDLPVLTLDVMDDG